MKRVTEPIVGRIPGHDDGLLSRGSRVACWARSESPGGKVAAKLLIAVPVRLWSRVVMWWASTSRLHPLATAASAYHNRRSTVGSFSMSAIWWYHGNCAS